MSWEALAGGGTCPGALVPGGDCPDTYNQSRHLYIEFAMSGFIIPHEISAKYYVTALLHNKSYTSIINYHKCKLQTLKSIHVKHTIKYLNNQEM